MDDAAVLGGALRGALGAPRLTVTSPPVTLTGGFSRTMLRVGVSGVPDGTPNDLVVRILPSLSARDREVAFQATLARAGFPTIDVVATGDGDEASGLGPFSVMPYVAGRPFVDLDSPRDMLGSFRRVPGQLATTMLTLHATDPAPVRAALGRPDPDADLTSLVGDVVDAAARTADASVIAAARRLAATAPSGEVVVCHGDLHPVNLVVREDGIVVLLDWELALLGPREFDLARTALVLELIPGIRITALRPLLTVFGRRAARAFLEAYRAGAPFDTARYEWCRALSSLRLLTVVLALQPDTAVARNWAPTRRTLRRIALAPIAGRAGAM